MVSQASRPGVRASRCGVQSQGEALPGLVFSLAGERTGPVLRRASRAGVLRYQCVCGALGVSQRPYKPGACLVTPLKPVFRCFTAPPRTAPHLFHLFLLLVTFLVRVRAGPHPTAKYNHPSLSPPRPARGL